MRKYIEFSIRWHNYFIFVLSLRHKVLFAFGLLGYCVAYTSGEIVMDDSGNYAWMRGWTYGTMRKHEDYWRYKWKWTFTNLRSFQYRMTTWSLLRTPHVRHVKLQVNAFLSAHWNVRAGLPKIIVFAQKSAFIQARENNRMYAALIIENNSNNYKGREGLWIPMNALKRLSKYMKWWN